MYFPASYPVQLEQYTRLSIIKPEVLLLHTVGSKQLDIEAANFVQLSCSTLSYLAAVNVVFTLLVLVLVI